MKIEFDPNDLKPKFKNLSAYQVSYEHLNDKAQKLLDIAGRGTFNSWDRQTYNAVWKPLCKPKTRAMPRVPRATHDEILVAPLR